MVRKVVNKLKWILKGCPNIPAYLEMIWPKNKFNPIYIDSMPSGYNLRQFNSSKDKDKYLALLELSGLGTCSLDYWEKHILPEGFFVIEQVSTGKIVASCMAAHHSTNRHPRAGNLGWLAVHPEHRGIKLGYIVSAAVVNRLIAGGYQQIYLETQDFRYAAMRIYLNLGWVPLLYQKDMYSRWEVVCKKLTWPFNPTSWKEQY